MDSLPRLIIFVWLGCLVTLGGCTSTPTKPASAPTMKLTCTDGRPVVRDVPPNAAYTRGSWLYARSPGGLRTALLAVSAVDAQGGFLSVYGLYSEGGPLEIPPAGLAVEGVPPDSTARVGKGLGNALRREGSEYDRVTDANRRLVMLRLDIGAGSGVEAGDMYQVLGPAIVDAQTRTLTGFERKAICRVAEGEVTAESAGCALDRVEFADYSRDDWIAGGRVRLDVDTRAELVCPER